MGDNPHVKLVRTSNWVYRLRKFGVFVDRIKVGSVANDEEFEFNITPGHHAIVLKVSWCTSETVEVDAVPDQKIELECGTRLKLKLFVLLMGLVVAGKAMMESNPAVGSILLGAGVLLGTKLTFDTFRPGKFLYLCKVTDAEKS